MDEFSGTVLKSVDEDRFVLMGIYSPNRVPGRGADTFIDLVSPRVLEKACWRFMDNGARVIWGHKTEKAQGRCVENYIYRNPIPWEVDLGDGRWEKVEKDDWVAGFLLEPEPWAAYKSGLIGGASLEGPAARAPASEEVLARVRGSA